MPKGVTNFNTDYDNREFAISYINGKIYDGDVHKDTIEQYLSDRNLDIDVINNSEGFVTEKEQEGFNLPMAFASYVRGRDGNDYIAIYPQSLFNITIEQFISAISQKYPNAIICVDDNDRYTCQSEDAYIKTI